MSGRPAVPWRVPAMLLTAGVICGAALLMGAPDAAAAAALATPVGVGGHLLLRWASVRPQETLARSIALAMGARMLAALAVILIAAGFGWRALLGALAGLTLEMSSAMAGIFVRRG